MGNGAASLAALHSSGGTEPSLQQLYIIDLKSCNGSSDVS